MLPAGMATARPAPNSGSAASSATAEKGRKRSRLSEASQSFRNLRKDEDGDEGAKNYVAPIVQFAIDLGKDPWIADQGRETC